MEYDPRSAVDLSAEAVLEMEEFREDLRSDTPSLTALFDMLRKPADAPSFGGRGGTSMLADIRSYELLRRSLMKSTNEPKPRPTDFNAFQAYLVKYLQELELAVQQKSETKIAEATRLCRALHDSFVAKQTMEIYERREHIDSRYLINDHLQ